MEVMNGRLPEDRTALSSLFYLFFFLAMPHSCGFLVPQTGIKPTPTFKGGTEF